MKWLKYSGVFLTLAVNPFHWRIGLDWGKDELNGWTLKLNFLPLGVHVVIDNGDW
jgi:hypothetical protein